MGDKFKEFEEQYNPLHFYSRLMDCNLKKEDARDFTKLYEQTIYKPVVFEMKENYTKNV